MKKIFNIFSLLMVTLLGLSLAACSEKDEFGTNQYQDGVRLNVFGPSPVMRGGQLRFLGSNLNNVKQVLIPGCEAITNITVVQSGVPSEIQVTVPQTAEPGKVVLVTNTDQEITTATPLAFTEPIEIESVAPASVMPGEQITIKGDYLNNIHCLSFADGVMVSEKNFKTHTRYEIGVVVPENARTGKIGLYDMDITTIEGAASDVTYNIIYTETALNIGTPSVSKITSPRGTATATGTIVAKMNEEIKIEGKHLDLVKELAFGDDGNIVKVSDFKVSADGNAITFNLTPSAPDGDIELICKSDIAVPVCKLQTVKPTELVASPKPVKNGNELTISGKDLDVVTSVLFPNVDGNTAIAVESTEASVKIAVPEYATDGDITLYMLNGASVTVPYTLVKPTVTAYSSNPVSAGGVLTITGTDLDLVAGVIFNGGDVASAVTPESVSETSMNLTVPMEALSGVVKLYLKNKTEVEVQEINVEEAVFCYAKSIPYPEDGIHAGETITLEVANLDKLTGVQINGTDCQIITSGSKLIIGVPENAKKDSKIRLISSNGEITYSYDFVPNTEITTVIWKGMKEVNWDGSLGEEGKLVSELSWGGFDWSSVSEGTTLEITFTPTNEGWSCIAPIDGSWNQIDGFEKKQYDYGTLEPQVWSVDLTAAMLNHLVNKGGLVLSGANVIYTSVKLIEHVSLETVLWKGEFNQAAWTNWEVGKGVYGDSNPNMFVEAGIKAGQTIRVYVTPTNPDWWQFQLFDGHWSGLAELGEATGANNGNNLNTNVYTLVDGAIVIPVTAPIAEKLNTLTDWGIAWIIQCENLIVTKITLE